MTDHTPSQPESQGSAASRLRSAASVVLTREQEAMLAALAGDQTPDVLLSSARCYAEEGRASHVAWRDHLTSAVPCGWCTPETIDAVGDADVQREWVRKYDVILLALSLVDETLTTRMVDAIAQISDEEERKSRVKNARHALRYRREAMSA